MDSDCFADEEDTPDDTSDTDVWIGDTDCVSLSGGGVSPFGGRRPCEELTADETLEGALEGSPCELAGSGCQTGALPSGLADHPEVLLLRVEAHADEVGSSEYNYELSQSRAKNVVNQLVTLGVEPERLQAIGTGEAQMSDTAAESRRVAFTVLIWDESLVFEGITAGE